MEGKIEINSNKCKSCGFCIKFCPNKSLNLSLKFNANGYHFVYLKEDAKCNGCGICALVCPDIAIEVYKK
ncbi:MAG: 4Fe-4S binding protein [bacterium]